MKEFLQSLEPEDVKMIAILEAILIFFGLVFGTAFLGISLMTAIWTFLLFSAPLPTGIWIYVKITNWINS